jgi:anti-sigma factor RsiW
VDAAIATDPALAQRLQRIHGLRTRLARAFEPMLDEPVPDRLKAALRPGALAPAVQVADLARVRAERAARTERPARQAPRWPQPTWWALAACLVGGVALGLFGGRAGETPDAFELAGGALVARGALDAALTSQRADNRATPVRMAVSFVDADGAYCRSFVIEQAQPVAGLACRAEGGWRVETLASAAPTVAVEGGLRPASTALPAAVLNVIDQRIAGEALDAAGEAVAIARGWRR